LKRASDHSRAVFGILIRTEAKSAPTPLLCSRSASACRSATPLISAIRASSGSKGFVPAASIAVAPCSSHRSRRSSVRSIQLRLWHSPRHRESAAGSAGSCPPVGRKWPSSDIPANRVGFHPPAHGELVEIVARLAGLVEIRGVETPGIWLSRRCRRRAQPGGRQSHRQDSNNRKDRTSRKKIVLTLSAPV